MTTIPSSAAADAERLLALVRQLAAELRPQFNRELELDSALESDAGIDSLARMELILRIEHAFSISLSEQSALTAHSVRDLLTALRAGNSTVTAADLDDAPIIPSSLSALRTPERANTLIDVLEWHAEHTPERTHIHLYGEAEAAEEITYADLLHGARSFAAGLLDLGLQTQQTVAIVLPTGKDFFFSFYGVLLAGGIPVPLYPPQNLTRIEDYVLRQAATLRNAETSLLIGEHYAQKYAALIKLHVPTLSTVTSPAALGQAALMPITTRPRAHDLALLQYTSGSTGDPKGVALSHANLLANVRAMGAAVRAGSDDVFVSWLPLYHDMGLIGACLGSLYHAFALVLMSPLAFIARPQRWLRALHRHRGTLSAAPNFAYDLCAQKLKDSDLAGLDLSHWRIAFNGAEPVSPTTLERFCTRFADYGFKRSAMTPVYGLAECCVGLAFPPLERGPRLQRLHRATFTERGLAVAAAAEDATALVTVACGLPLPGHDLRIVDESGRELPDGTQGRLQFRGPSATRGYYRNAPATRALIHGEWLESGDYAYLDQGEVFVTGRAKDLIIRAGRNLYPYALEEAAGALPGLRKGGVAVFSSLDAGTGKERLVVLAETRERDSERRQKLKDAITQLTLEHMQTLPDDIVLAPLRSVAKTSSGKIRRPLCRERYERGLIGQHSSPARQYARLLLAGIAPLTRRMRYRAAENLYALYVWSLTLALAPLGWLLVVCLPKRTWRSDTARFLLRALLVAAAIHLRVRGAEHLPRGQAYIMVANHQSYADGLVLRAALSGDFTFVAKRELKHHTAVYWLLKRLGTAFVERRDAQQSVHDSGQLAALVKRGEALLFFPEGTFTRAPGLREFRLGAFTIAVAEGVPVIPISVRGTRRLLRADQWFPRRSALEVRILPPLSAAGESWNAALALRAAARAEILRHCGEPDGASTLPTQRADDPSL